MWVRQECAQSSIAQPEPGPKEHGEINGEEHVAGPRVEDTHVDRNGTSEKPGEDQGSEDGGTFPEMKRDAGQEDAADTAERLRGNAQGRGALHNRSGRNQFHHAVECQEKTNKAREAPADTTLDAGNGREGKA